MLMEVRFGPYLYTQFGVKTNQSLILFARTKAGRERAIKILSLPLAREEFKLTSQFNNPHIVKVFSQGRTNEGFLGTYFSNPNELGWFAMERLEADNLREQLKMETINFPAHVVLEQMFAISQALLPYWKEGGFHLDIKPGNIVPVPDRGWVLLDFGSAAQYWYFQRQGGINQTVCTLAYAAPEYLSHRLPHTGGDFFSIGATIFYSMFKQFICGRPKTAENLSSWYQHNKPEEVFSRKINRRLLDFFLGACAFSPNKRVNNPDEFLGLLERAKEEAKTARPS